MCTRIRKFLTPFNCKKRQEYGGCKYDKNENDYAAP